MVYQILSNFCIEINPSLNRDLFVCTPTLQGPRYGVYSQKIRIKNVSNKKCTMSVILYIQCSHGSNWIVINPKQN